MRRPRELAMVIVFLVGILGSLGANASNHARHRHHADLGRMTCGQYLALVNKYVQAHRMVTVSGIMMWVYGYASNESHNTSIDRGQFRHFANKLWHQCTAHPHAPFLATVKQVGVH